MSVMLLVILSVILSVTYILFALHYISIYLIWLNVLDL